MIFIEQKEAVPMNRKRKAVLFLSLAGVLLAACLAGGLLPLLEPAAPAAVCLLAPQPS